MESQYTSYTQPADPTSMLQFLNPKEEIEEILLLMLGLKKETRLINGRLTDVIIRVNKPIFADEYARSIVADLRSFLNYTVQVSRFENNEIRIKVGNYLKKLAVSLATHGDDAYVSHKTWERILNIYESETDVNNEYIGWKKFNISWTYHKPVEMEMLLLVKDNKEEMDQAVEFDRILSTFGAVIHASFNKSYTPDGKTAGMLLGGMTQIRTESQQVREKDKKTWGGSVFGNN